MSKSAAIPPPIPIPAAALVLKPVVALPSSAVVAEGTVAVAVVVLRSLWLCVGVLWADVVMVTISPATMRIIGPLARIQLLDQTPVVVPALIFVITPAESVEK
jgi:hypothetical protein